MNLLEKRSHSDLGNRKAIIKPKYDPQKRDLPKRSDYVGQFRSSRQSVNVLGTRLFLLWTRCLCQGSFGGRSAEEIYFKPIIYNRKIFKAGVIRLVFLQSGNSTVHNFKIS